MPRNYTSTARLLRPDPKFGSLLATKIINKLMWGGKRSTAEGILYKAFDIIKDKTGDDPVKVFKKAVDTVKPSLEVTSRRVKCDGGGGALGHPVVFYDMGEESFVECGYCDRRFVLRGGPADGADQAGLPDIAAGAS